MSVAPRSLLRLLAVVGAVAMALLAAPTASVAEHVPAHAADEAHLHSHGPDPVTRALQGTPPSADPTLITAREPWDASEHDGVAYTADRPDLPAGDGAVLPSFHLIYVHPSDRASRFAQFAAMFQADARKSSRILTTLRGHDLRWDWRLDSRAGRASEQILDVSVLRSRNAYKRLANNSRVFSMVAEEVAKTFRDPNKKYVVFLDAPQTFACGQGTRHADTQRTSANASDTQRTTAIVYQAGTLTDPTTGGWCRGSVLLHELGHNMGALLPQAPNAFDGAHCDDNYYDVMCYSNSPDRGEATFDYANDDYWDAGANTLTGDGVKLPWWTVNLSRFLCPPPLEGETSSCGRPNQPRY